MPGIERDIKKKNKEKRIRKEKKGRKKEREQWAKHTLTESRGEWQENQQTNEIRRN